MGLLYLPVLHFQNQKLCEAVERRCEQALHKDRLDRKQLWLGAYYAKELETAWSPPFQIEWISDSIGYGVFAAKALPHSVFIGEYAGVLRKHPWIWFHSSYYNFAYEIYPGSRTSYYIDAEKGGNVTRFINHSDQPNLEPISVYHKGIVHIVLRTVRPIAKGEQLTYDYGPDYWKRRKDKKAIPSS